MRRSLVLILLFFAACGREWQSPLEPPPPSGLIAFYPFNGNANDASGNGYHGTLVNASANGTLIIGNNTSDRLIIPSNVLHGRSDFTILARVKISAIHDESAEYSLNTLVSAATASNDNSFCIGFKGNQKRWKIYFNQVIFSFSTTNNIWEGKWYHVVVTREGSFANFFINGEQIGSSLSVSNSAIAIASGGLVIGQEQDSVGGSFDIRQSFWGEIDDLLFYDHALTEEEIKKLAETGK